MQQENNYHSNHQQQFQQRREEQQQLHRDRQEHRQERRRRYANPEEHRYIRYMLRLYERNPRRYEEELGEQKYQAYLEQRSPTFNEMTDEILEERQLEDYDLERMNPQERQEIWEQEQLNELEGNPAPQAHGLPLDNVQKYANFLQKQLRLDQHQQTMLVYDMQNNDYAEGCRRNDELLMQKEQWEDIAFRQQQQLQ